MINIEEENPENQYATIQQMLEVVEDSSSDDNHSDESASEKEF
ncbi:4365_t:CDS:2 [Dentiscutata erythropus]|uniref:4365_t:CDS:1 n=1 Tax=Dentiscutata erythropus TaxID=1348616 RepID=A0A9N9B3R2_9GLOM|nr:4365_t:CDS:2 [Dentiscutata erythropus]